VLENIFSFQFNDQKLKIFYEYGFYHYLKEFELNINKYCYDNGQNLSKGQRQIISFLSLFFNCEKVFLLDECLNSVNSQTREELILKLKQHFPDNFVIYTSHELNDMKLFNYVLKLNEIFKNK
jgi:ABC-type bacteriocin/lantibiotic exporter with double-glycine peptidase domain